jgi:hypothetical protein
VKSSLPLVSGFDIFVATSKFQLAEDKQSLWGDSRMAEVIKQIAPDK